MNRKVDYTITTIIAILCLIPIIDGIIVFLLKRGQSPERASEALIQLLFASVVFLICFLIYKVTSFIEHQETYFNNRIKSLQKQIDSLKEKIKE